ncbi:MULTISPECIES: GNAT family N-acetyltransferase [unclassified Streptomyces]|uniref:GNAT family N-acetyltransferase n=1 Tax=unclassified Streptomyces TaxID=2593676 RepID=UPI00158710AE|nr:MULTISPECIES: GNAT family N-acetyltransferase [unclassified Streptomyces]NUV72155.1 GNAT family N-acetyltransferase [Streptomyces sp. CAI-121]NUW02261.1 GNAT family N-acetyltransferase [Streptomyces sp. CAI 127]NUW18197.1 GNAT family N-acetyltransferase [Streptomyces sp. CAI-68]
MSSSSPAPTDSPAPADLTTERLILRSWTSQEATAVLEGSRSTRWADDFPAEGDRVIASLFGEHPAWLDAYGHRLVVECESGLAVGSIGLFWPPAEGVVGIGYGIVASRRGRGYATEATRALAEFALTAAEVHTVSADVEGTNPASVRVLEKAGFQRWAAAENADHLARFRITRQDRARR